MADSGGTGRHSVFAAAFIDVLLENETVLDSTLFFSKIRHPVMVNSDQTPEYADIRRAGHEGVIFFSCAGSSGIVEFEISSNRFWG